VFGVEPLEETLSSSLAERRFTMLLLGSFAGLTLFLAAVGVYGVLSHGVVQRTREIGLRLALGAQRSSVLRLVIGQALVSVAAGLVVGVAGALVVTRWLGTLLYGITPTDPLTFITAAAVLVLVALAASYLPARRASRVDPAVALRMD
jgi:ABC-type antimicrobial peptide transport system permease subunit